MPRLGSHAYAIALGVFNKLGYSVTVKPTTMLTPRILGESNPGQLRTWNTKSWSRVIMYNAIADFLESHAKDCEGRVAVEVGGCEGTFKTILESLGVKYVVAREYPKIDICNLPYEDNSYDFVIADQVLEHTMKPWVAADEIRRVLRSGGFAIVTAPFIHAYHAGQEWRDYWRFSPEAWRILFEKYEILVADGWGNADAVRAGWKESDIGLSAQTTPTEEGFTRGLLEKNDRINFIMTWCIARKTH